MKEERQAPTGQGAAIVPRTFVACLMADQASYLWQDPDWTPTLGKNGPFTASDLVNYALNLSGATRFRLRMSARWKGTTRLLCNDVTVRPEFPGRTGLTQARQKLGPLLEEPGLTVSVRNRLVWDVATLTTCSVLLPRSVRRSMANGGGQSEITVKGFQHGTD